MRKYELTVILRPTSVDEGKEAFAQILQKFDATVVSDDDWGLKKLAYPIDEVKEGFYLFKIVEAKPESVEEITREFRLNSVFLRSMFVVIEDTKKTA